MGLRTLSWEVGGLEKLLAFVWNGHYEGNEQCFVSDLVGVCVLEAMYFTTSIFKCTYFEPYGENEGFAGRHVPHASPGANS